MYSHGTCVGAEGSPEPRQAWVEKDTWDTLVTWETRQLTCGREGQDAWVTRVTWDTGQLTDVGREGHVGHLGYGRLFVGNNFAANRRIVAWVGRDTWGTWVTKQPETGSECR